MMEYLPLKNILLSVHVLRCIYSKGRYLDTMAITPALLTPMEIFVNFKSSTVLDINKSFHKLTVTYTEWRGKSTVPQDGTFPTKLLTNLPLIKASFNELQSTHANYHYSILPIQQQSMDEPVKKWCFETNRIELQSVFLSHPSNHWKLKGEKMACGISYCCGYCAQFLKLSPCVPFWCLSYKINYVSNFCLFSIEGT